MGSSETDKSAKDPKTPNPPPPNTQEQSSATSTAVVAPEWPPGYQAFSPMPPPGFMASSPQGQPYVWSVQPIMPPPYGTPPPHPYMNMAMYPHGMYAHHSMPPGTYPYCPYPMPTSNGMVEAPANTPGSTDVDAKVPEGKEKLPIKRSRGSLGSLNMITGKNNEVNKPSGPSSNGDCSKSGESGSDRSSQGSDSNSQNESHSNPRGGQDSLEANDSQNGNRANGSQNGTPNANHTMVNATMSILPMPVAAPGAVTGPATNLNIGMDYWGVAATPAMHGKVPPVATGVVAPGSRDNLHTQIWLQDERELKRQRRKQSNRESARRSRLRKQAECDELAQRAEVLKEENANLRTELNRIRSEYEQILAENKALKERFGDASDLGPKMTIQHLDNEAAQQPIGKTDLVDSSGGP